MSELNSHDSQQPQPRTGEELLAMVPEGASASIQRIDLMNRTKSFIESHAGEVGRFFWGVSVTETGHTTELGFSPAIVE